MSALPACMGSILYVGCLITTAAVAADGPESTTPFVTNIGQLRHLDSLPPNISCSISLTGSVWWANPTQGRFVLQDASGAEVLEMDLAGQRLSAGQRVQLEGHGTITRRRVGFRLGPKGPVVDNNGVHGMIEKSGTVYLSAGQHPIRVEWFNGVDKYGLELDYEGSGLPRQTVRVNGLEYRCYEGAWRVLPDFDQVVAVKHGTATNFDLSVRTRDEQVALQFTGRVEVPRDGAYTFYLKSDDGSRLYISAPAIHAQVIGRADPPVRRRITIGQILSEGE